MATKNRNTKISTQEEYNSAMQRIDTIMKKGEARITKEEGDELRNLALLAQAYEKEIFPAPKITTLEGLLEYYMYDRRLRQGEMAKKLGVSNAKFSLILSGKQKPDVPFLKAVHKELHIDGNQLLQMV